MTYTNNEHVQEYLEFYLSMPVSPQFAVLLKGKWGTGKTWFVDQMTTRLRESGKKVLCVSLYGIASIDGVDREIFRQLHPLLGSKSAVIAGRLLTGVLKTTFSFDLNRDGDKDSIELSVPTIDISKMFEAAEDAILVFDDLERCLIPLPILLGYINHFVEHGGHKVVLVANDEAILEKQDQKDTYLKIKEKLIGREFEVAPDLEGAAAAFTAEVAHGPTIQAFKDNAVTIRETFVASGYKNLRHLRQSMLELERLLKGLNTKYYGHKPLISHLLQFFLIYSFETRSGSLRPSDILDFGDVYSAYLREKEPDSIFKRLSGKYATVEMRSPLLPYSVWHRIFDTGQFNYKEISEALDNSVYLASQHQPDWVRLWHSFSLDDTEGEELLRKVSSQFKSREYADIGVVLHVSGELLWFSEIGVYPVKRRQITEDAKSYIDHLKATGQLLGLSRRSTTQSFSDHLSYAGLGFHERDAADFRSITAYLREQINASEQESLPSEAAQLLVELQANTELFARRIIQSSHEDNLFHKVPILQYILPAEFSAAFLNLHQEKMRRVVIALDERYKMSAFNAELVAETAWLQKVRLLILAERKRRPATLSGYMLSVAADKLSAAVATLKGVERKASESNSLTRKRRSRA